MMIINVVIESIVFVCPQRNDVLVEANWLYNIDDTEGEDAQANIDEGGETDIEMYRRELISHTPPYLTPSPDRHPSHPPRAHYSNQFLPHIRLLLPLLLQVEIIITV